MDNTLLSKLKQLSKDIPNEIFLFGKTLRDFIFLDKISEKIEVFIKTKPDDTLDRQILQKYTIDFSFVYGEEIPNKNTHFTIDNIYVRITEDTETITPKGDGFTDLTMGIIKLTPFGDSEIENNPEIILDTIRLLSETSFSLGLDSMKTLFFKNKNLSKITDKRKIYRFLVDILVISKKTRKVIATVNTLGIASVLFGANLFETAILNHLSKKDINEFFSIIFKNVKHDDLKDVLVYKAGVLERDTHSIIELCECIKQIKTEDDITARKILNICGKENVQSLTRLLKSLGYKKLSKLLKNQLAAAVSLEDLDLTTEVIKNSFHVPDIEANKLLDLAMNKVITEPSYNERDKLLIYLNKERKGSL